MSSVTVTETVARLMHFVRGTVWYEEDSCYRTTNTRTNIQCTGVIENMYYYREVYFQNGLPR